MKWIFRALFGLLGMAVLAACAPAAPVASVGADSAGAEASYEGLHPPQDLSLVASTGQPQFIVSYADW